MLKLCHAANNRHVQNDNHKIKKHRLTDKAVKQQVEQLSFRPHNPIGHATGSESAEGGQVRWVHTELGDK